MFTLQISFKPLLLKRSRDGVNPLVEVAMNNSKEENYQDFCPNYVQEVGLWWNCVLGPYRINVLIKEKSSKEFKAGSYLMERCPLPLRDRHKRLLFIILYFWGGFFSFCSYNIQHCFICRPSDSIVQTDTGIEPRTVATCALADRHSNH